MKVIEEGEEEKRLKEDLNLSSTQLSSFEEPKI
jgi:hypothetical protein